MRTPTRRVREKHDVRSVEDTGDLPSSLEERLPMVAIVGRPNVGKSTLFNRLLQRGGSIQRFAGKALVHEKAGMTRDRRVERIEWENQAFLCTDTGGFDTELEDPLLESVAEQARIAVAEADVIVFLTAVGEESHPAERELIEILRRSKKPILVGVNKCDNVRLDHQSGDFFRHGFDSIFPVSALHGRGVGDLLDAVTEELGRVDASGRSYASGGIQIAIVGRQNVGKSSLINRLLGEERLIESALPGTTRDAIDTTIKTADGEIYTLIDTAGIRRRGKVERGFEKLSVLSSLMAMRRAHVAVLLVDGSVGLTAQDARIAGYCLDEGLACMILINKWDLVEKDHLTADRITKSLEREWSFLRYAPVLYVSALTGQRVGRVFELARRVYDNAGRRIATARLNDLLETWVRRKSPPSRRNRQPKISYIAQTGIHPPRFTLFVNDPELFHFSYQRYLINRIREEEDFEGTPIRLNFRAKSKRDREEQHGPAAPAGGKSERAKKRS